MDGLGNALKFNDEIEIDFPEDGEFAGDGEYIETGTEPTFEDLFPEVCEMVDNISVFGSDRLFFGDNREDAFTLNTLDYPAIVLKDGCSDDSKCWGKIAEAIQGKKIFLIQGSFGQSQRKTKMFVKLLRDRNDIRVIRLCRCWQDMPKDKGLAEFFDIEGNINRFPDLMKTAEAVNEKKKRFPEAIDSSYYNTSNIPEPEWMIENILPDQGLTQLSAKPKAGKTYLCYDFALAVVKGTEFLGTKVKQGTVLYFDIETSERQRQERLKRLCDGEPIPSGIKFYSKAAKIKDGFIQQLEEALDQNPDTVLIIVDTIKKIRSQKSGASDQNLHDDEEIGALAEFVHDRNLLMVCTNHLKKEPTEDPFDASLGSQGIAGACDTLLVITQRQNDQGITTDRTLHVRGREVEEEHFAMRFENCRWSKISTMADFTAVEERQDFFENPIVKTVLMLLSEKDEWKGRSLDFKNECAKACGISLTKTSQAISNEITKLNPKLITYCGIDYEAIKYQGKNSKIHHFFKLGSQQEIDEREEKQIMQSLIEEGFTEV